MLADVRDFHPFTSRIPHHGSELAEEIGARLTVLAVRTHVPTRGQPAPMVTLRMRHALRMLARSGGQLTVSALAREIGTGVAAASQLSARMFRRGLVTKRQKRDGGTIRDGRVTAVVLSSEGWGFVPRDEPPQREPSWMRFGPQANDDRLGSRAWPKGVRRRTQPPSAIETGLACSALRPQALLAGLRAVQATLYGFDYTRWEMEFQRAIVARRRNRRDRPGERYALAWSPRPEYRSAPVRGRQATAHGAKQEARRLEAMRRLDELLRM